MIKNKNYRNRYHRLKTFIKKKKKSHILEGLRFRPRVSSLPQKKKRFRPGGELPLIMFTNIYIKI